MKKILIIEDDCFTANVYRKTFEMAGYEVAVANDGAVGLKLLDEFQPDLVQVDLMMPKLNGVEIIRTIRSNPALKTLPILVVSTCYLTDMVKEAWKAGATRVIAKAESSSKNLLERVETLLAAAPPAPVPPQTPITTPAPAAGTLARLEPESDASHQKLRQEFLKGAPQIQKELRGHLHALILSPPEASPPAGLVELHRTVHSLTCGANLTGLVRIAHLAGSLEVLLQELQDAPRKITQSTLNTVARAVDCLKHLFARALQSPQDEFSQTALILAVDDEPIALRTLTAALSKANLRALSLDDPEVALRLLATNRFDLIFLDAEMPGVDGFEVCQRLRASTENRQTPVVFVTALLEFKDRVRATQSGGNDLIAKPFPLIEVAVKALTYLVNPKPDAAAPAPARALAA